MEKHRFLSFVYAIHSGTRILIRAPSNNHTPRKNCNLTLQSAVSRVGCMWVFIHAPSQRLEAGLFHSQLWQLPAGWSLAHLSVSWVPRLLFWSGSAVRGFREGRILAHCSQQATACGHQRALPTSLAQAVLPFVRWLPSLKKGEQKAFAFTPQNTPGTQAWFSSKHCSQDTGVSHARVLSQIWVLSPSGEADPHTRVEILDFISCLCRDGCEVVNPQS